MARTSDMMPIQDQLHRIRWDPTFGEGDFRIGYFDRVENKIMVVALCEVHVEAGNRCCLELTDSQGMLHSIPLHRVKAVYKDGRLIWHRDR